MMKYMSPRVIAALLKEKIPLEASLKQSYMSAKQKAKNTVISKLKQNSKSFFSFVKSKQKTRARVVAYSLIQKINQDPANTAEVLKKQYDTVYCCYKRPQWSVNDPVSFYKIPEDETNFFSNFNIDIDIENWAGGPDITYWLQQPGCILCQKLVIIFFTLS